MNRYYLAGAAVLVSLLLTVPVFGQSANASLSGTVTDATGGVLPGVNVIATNMATGVATPTVTNAAGVYNFPSLPPGTYKVTAELAGFQTQTFTDVLLNARSLVRLNITMEVRKLEQQVEVTVSTDRLLLESSASVGVVLPEKVVTDLPLVNNNVLDLVKVMGGVVLTDQNPVFAAENTVMAGVSMRDINLQRDGITINEVRYASGLQSPLRLNNEMVGEFKVMLSPVDAESGRGGGSIQIVSKSGGNAYRGSVVWSGQNTALDSNEFFRNKAGTTPDWRNLHEITANVGGPIIKNKTFFFVLYNHQIAMKRQNQNPVVLTPCARKGIFRWYDGWMNTNAMGTEIFTGLTPTRRAVDRAGNLIPPTTTPTGAPFTGQLRLAYVFGQLKPNSITDTINCTDFDPADDVIPNTPWNPYRTRKDPTGYIDRFTAMMPPVNNWDVGDGLNTAGHRWILGLKGGDNVFGLGEDSYRKQINIRIDHNFSTRHRMNVNYSYEKSTADDSFPHWPEQYGGYGGWIRRIPQYFSVTLTSTLRPTLLNEFRVGLSRTDTMTYDAIYNPQTGPKLQEVMQKLYSTANLPNYKDLPLHINPGAGTFAFYTDTWLMGGNASNPVGSRGNLAVTFGGYDPRWTYADTVTWTKGRHSFKWGAEVRMAKSYQIRQGTGTFFGDANVYTSVYGGSIAAFSPITGISAAQPGLTGLIGAGNTFGTALNMANLLNYFAGSVSQLRNYLFVNSPTALTWNNYSKGETDRVFDIRLKEFNIFFKDDWKVTDNLTLNLGIRYDYYGVPYENTGMTVGLEGGPLSIFGISDRSFDKWLGSAPTTGGSLMKQIFVGPNSPNPKMQVFNDDFNNIGPAVGFAYQIPWFGKGKTTLRGGYQASFVPIARADGIAGVIANTIGTRYVNTYTGDSATPYMDLTMLPNLVPVPVPPTVIPLQPIDIRERSQAYTVYDQNLQNPYIQSLTMAVVRNIGSNLTLDVRYIGTLSRKQLGTININSPSFLKNGLKEAFDAARYGGESELLDRIFRGINYAGSGYGPVGTVTGGVLQTGAMHLRANTATATNLANGNYAALASTLATANYSTAMPGNATLPPIPTGIRGAILRHNGFPENFIFTNPQLMTANITGNINYSNYHSMQVQVTLRPTHGFSFVNTYTWSRNLGLVAPYTDVTNRAADYTLLSNHRSHQLVSYGTFDLPFGQNRLLFRDASRLVDAFIGGWQLSWIANVASGSPNSITAVNTTLFANSIPDFVGPPGSFSTKMAQVTWAPGALEGDYFGAKYVKIRDPQCDNVTTAQNLRASCTLQALALAEDRSVIVFQNPYPGVRGNFGRMNVTNVGRWSVDAAMGKIFRVAEGKTINFRVDATNVFNHPTPSLGWATVSTRYAIATNPDMTLGGTNRFGLLNNKVGYRTFQVKIRFDF